VGLEPVDADRRLDVREVDDEPFGDVTAGLRKLESDESLLLIDGFEPEPLYDVLEQRGFAYETANPKPDLWHVEITHA